MNTQPEHPWKIDTNDRYRHLATTLISFSTAALVLPVFLAREFYGLPTDEALSNALPCGAYIAWVLLAISILSGVVFHFFSGKWVRLAWGKPISVFRIPLSEASTERILEASLWLCILGFLVGVGIMIVSLATFAPGP